MMYYITEAQEKAMARGADPENYLHTLQVAIGYTYFLAAGGQYVKIGYSKNPIKRCQKKQSFCPLQHRLLFCVVGDYETFFHKMFSSLFVNGEWYKLGLTNIIDVFRSVQSGDIAIPIKYKRHYALVDMNYFNDRHDAFNHVSELYKGN